MCMHKITICMCYAGNADLRDAQGQARGNTYGGTTMHWGPFWPYNKYYLTSNWK